MDNRLRDALPDIGYQGPLWTVEFADFVYRNAYRPDRLRFIHSRWGDRYHNNAPPGTCTLVNGAFGEGLGYNVPHPQIPELTVISRETGRVEHRGWRGLVQMLLTDRVLKPTREVERLIGYTLMSEMEKEIPGCV